MKKIVVIDCEGNLVSTGMFETLGDFFTLEMGEEVYGNGAERIGNRDCTITVMETLS